MVNAITEHSYDVVVVGGGPAGASTGALLAEKGHRVAILEKEHFPRYHVGESLMPFCYFSLERLGVLDKMKEIGYTQKLSVQFVNMDGKRSNPFYFFQHRDHPSSYTWQVERSDFDQMLFQRAAACGAETIEGFRVTQFLRDDSGTVVGVKGTGQDGTEKVFHAKVTVDATGRDALAMSKERWRERDPELGKIAIWTYFRGAKRDPGLDAGSTTVAYLPEKGWFWYIPLRNDIVSVGVVADRDYLYSDSRDPAEIVTREIEKNAWIKDHLASGEQFGEYWVTGEYSYRSRYCADSGLVLVGDAFAFLDPVFSSGVFLALKSGEMAADAIDRALVSNDTSASRFEPYGAELCSHIETMRKLVYAFYDDNFSFGKLVRKHPDIRGDLTDCLVGNVATDFAKLFEGMRDFAELPAELDYGFKAAPTANANAVADAAAV
jgi:flavin-dependent dehydrogenase